jgi:hypothetical protein
MAAYLAAVLTIIEAREHFPETEDLDRLTVPEAVHLAAALFLTVQHDATHLFAWSRWRRRKNKQAKRSHYRTAVTANLAPFDPGCSRKADHDAQGQRW